MLVLERRDLETGLPDDTYAQVSLACNRFGEQAVKDNGFNGSACSNLVWDFYTGAGAAQFPQSPNMRASVSFECANSKRHYALTHCSAIWWIICPNRLCADPLALIAFQSHSSPKRT